MRLRIRRGSETRVGRAEGQRGAKRQTFEVSAVLDRMWSPWRAQYIRESSRETGLEEACFLCRGLAGSDDRAHLLVWRGHHSVVVLNRYPYNNGHLLVAPRLHRGTMEDLTGPDLLEPIETVRWMIRVLGRMLRPQGYNVGLNQGKAAAQGFPDTCTGILFPAGTEIRTSCP